VRLILIPAVQHPDDQIRWLYRLMTLFQVPGFLPHLIQSPTPESFIAYLRASLNALPL
jgi:mannitol/fructose-specific phosphotransferase system IIA component (Ntr-type)